MRVLSVGNMYPPASTGGYELIWRSAVEHLRRSGHEVRVLTSDHGADSLGDEDDVSRRLRLYWSEYEFPRLSIAERLRLERRNAVAFEAELDRFGPDVVNWWAMGGMSLSLLERARRSGTPAVGVVGDDWMLYGPTVDAWTRTFARLGIGSIAGLLTGIPAERRFGRAARWLFISETLRRRAADAGRAPASAEVVRRGPDERFGPAPAADWGGRLLYAGRIDPRKGIATAIDALALIDSRASLTIDGDGDPRHRAELEARARAAGVHPRVTFEVSPRDQVPDAYAAADAVVFPVAWEEPWGLVPLEAMAVGRPVVATGAGGSGEYLRGDENCLMFEPGDASGLAAAIGRLASEPELRDRLRAAGFETAARFGERSFNDRIERVLAEEAASE